MVHILPSSPIVPIVPIGPIVPIVPIVPIGPIGPIGHIGPIVHIKHAQHNVRGLCHLFRFVHAQLFQRVQSVSVQTSRVTQHHRVPTNVQPCFNHVTGGARYLSKTKEEKENISISINQVNHPGQEIV
jgi:hypothetical protein